MFAPGDRLRNYEIAALLRAGGMGTLLLGSRHGAAGFVQPVAIKVIHQHLSHDERFRESFVSEALLASRISHPNVVRVEELGEENGVYFIVMEYVHGFSLAELMTTLYRTRRAMTAAVSVSIAMKIADGLHAAHELRGENGELLGLVHRDVSPHNVLISYDGHVKLTDFGVAKAQGFAGGTATGSLKGKIRYMSPEQAHGRELTRTSDVYSLGLVIWEMLTHRRAFKSGKDLAVLDAVRNPQIDPPSTIAAAVPKEIDEVVMQALQVDPTQRPQTALELKRMLSKAVPGANLMDGARIADLLADVMQDKAKAKEAQLPAMARSAFAPLQPNAAASELTNAMVDNVSSDEARAFVEDLSVPPPGATPHETDGTGQLRPDPARRRKVLPIVVLAAALIALVAIGAVGLLSPEPEPITIDSTTAPPPPVAPSPAVETPPPEPPAAVAPPPPPPGARKKNRVKRRRTRDRKKKPSATEVDGVPMIEEPSF